MTGSAVHWFGDRAVVVPMPDPRTRSALVAALRQEFGAMRVRVGMETVLVLAIEPDPRLRDHVADWLAGAVLDACDVGASAPTVEIPVDYDGADLDATAQALGCDVSTLVAAHSGQSWSVAMMGFAPGFGYLVPVGEMLLPWSHVPRLDSPRPRVPGGSVAVAAGMSAVYPTPMPGGWRLLGTTDVVLFDPDDDRGPTLLRPGHRVRFVERSRRGPRT